LGAFASGTFHALSGPQAEEVFECFNRGMHMNNAALNVTTQAQDQCDLESDPSLRHGANWYQLSTADVLERFSTSEETGLTEQQVAERRATFGLNCLPDSHQRSPWRIFMEQLQGPMVLLLIIVAIVSVSYTHLRAHET